METKHFSFKTLDESGTGQAVIARLGVIDRDGDVMVPGVIGEQTVAVVPNHNADGAPLGKAFVSEIGDEAIAQVGILILYCRFRSFFHIMSPFAASKQKKWPIVPSQ